MKPLVQSMTGRMVPCCLLFTISAVIAILLAFYFLAFGSQRGASLNLDRPSPFQLIKQERLLDILTANKIPKGLDYRLNGDRILDVRLRLPLSSTTLDLQVEEVEVVALDEQHWPPLYGDLRLHGFDLALDGAGLPDWLQRLKGDAIVTYRLNPESRTLDLPELAIEVPSLGIAEIALSLDDINPVLLLAALDASAISTLSITLTDEGLVANCLALLAKEEGLSEAVLRQNIYGLASLLQSKSGYPFLREVLEAIKVIAQTRKDGLIISLSATPEKAFPLSQLSRLKLSPLPDLSVLNALNLRIDTD